MDFQPRLFDGDRSERFEGTHLTLSTVWGVRAKISWAPVLESYLRSYGILPPHRFDGSDFLREETTTRNYHLVSFCYHPANQHKLAQISPIDLEQAVRRRLKLYPCLVRELVVVTYNWPMDLQRRRVFVLTPSTSKQWYIEYFDEEWRLGFVPSWPGQIKQEDLILVYQLRD